MIHAAVYYVTKKVKCVWRWNNRPLASCLTLALSIRRITSFISHYSVSSASSSPLLLLYSLPLFLLALYLSFSSLSSIRLISLISFVSSRPFFVVPFHASRFKLMLIGLRPRVACMNSPGGAQCESWVGRRRAEIKVSSHFITSLHHQTT